MFLFPKIFTPENQSANQNVYNHGRKIEIWTSQFQIRFAKKPIFEYRLIVFTDRQSQANLDAIIRVFLALNRNNEISCPPNFFYYENGLVYTSRKIPEKSIIKKFDFQRKNYQIDFRLIKCHNTFKECKLNFENVLRLKLNKKMNASNIDSMVVVERHDFLAEANIQILIGFRLKIFKPECLINLVREVKIINQNLEHVIHRHTDLPENISDFVEQELNLDSESQLNFLKQCMSKCRPFLKDFGIELLLCDYTPMTVFGRELQNPPLIPSIAGKFYQPPPGVIQWVIFSLSKEFDQDKIDKFENYFEKRAHMYGIRLDECAAKLCLNVEDKEALQTIFHRLSINQVNYAFFALKDEQKIGDISAYNLIKTYSNTSNVQCQVFSTRNFSDFEKNNHLDSLAIKMCLRMGGKTRIVNPSFWRQYPFDTSETMMVGVHIHRFNLNSRQIFCHTIVATMDADFWQYSSEMKISDKRDYDVLVKIFQDKILKKYLEKNDNKPKNVIIFFDHHCSNCIPIFIDNLKVKNPHVIFTSIIVHRNAQFKFFPKNNNQAPIPVGTLIEDDFLAEKTYRYNQEPYSFYICVRSENSFFRSIKYTILDEHLCLSFEQIQNLCFAMCHYDYYQFCCNDTPVPLEFALKHARKAVNKFLNELKPIIEKNINDNNNHNHKLNMANLIEHFSRFVSFTESSPFTFL